MVGEWKICSFSGDPDDKSTATYELDRKVIVARVMARAMYDSSQAGAAYDLPDRGRHTFRLPQPTPYDRRDSKQQAGVIATEVSDQLVRR